MKVRMLRSPEIVTYSDAMDNLKRCSGLVDEYMQAQRDKDKNASLTARLKVSLFVPSGVYIRGDDEARKEHFAIFGVKKTRAKVHRERVFYVPIVSLNADGGFMGDWSVVPLIDTDGFLVPIMRDGYCGSRFVRVAELVHG